MKPGASESRLWHILNLGREYLTHWAIAGAIIALTGFAPDHWVADLLSHLAIPESVRHALQPAFDIRVGLVAIGVAIIAWDVLRRSKLQNSGALHDSQIETKHLVQTPSRGSDDQKTLQGTEAQTLALPDKPSIAVLPFQNMSGDPEQEYFADGMAEEILTALSYCKSLFVIARNSSFTYKGKAIDVRQVGRELGVRYVLEGSVRRSGDLLRFTGQLVDATSGVHIWADRFDGGISDVFKLQDRIAESVVAAIEPNVQLAEIERMKHKPVANLDAYDFLLRAQQLEYEFTAESFDTALRCLEQALNIDPNYAQAMALAAYCYAERSQQGWLKDRARETAEGIRLATRAVELAKNDANVLWMAAYAARQLSMDAQLAKELAYRSLQLNPNSAIALAMAGWIEAILANPIKALELLHRADRLSPRDPRTWFIATGIGMAHFIADQFDEAIVWTKKALAQNPRSAVALRLLAASLTSLGQKDRASEVMRDLRKIEPHLTISSLRTRMLMAHESVWTKFSEALRLAGLPE